MTFSVSFGTIIGMLSLGTGIGLAFGAVGLMIYGIALIAVDLWAAGA